MVNQSENSEHWFSLIINSIDSAIITTNEKGLVTFMNPCAENLTGWNQSDAYGKNLSLVFNVDDKESIKPFVSPEIYIFKESNKLYKKNTIVLFPKKGKELYVNCSITKLNDNSGDAIGFTIVFHDVTNERKLIEQLRYAEKTEIIGKLVSGITHDFNNVLTVINGNSEVLLSKLQKTDPLRYMVEEISEAGKHAANITNQLMMISYHQKTKIRVFDLNSILYKLENLIYSIIGEDINIELYTSNDPLMIESDPVQIEQSIINLLVNAKDATPLGGRISVRTAKVELNIEFSKIHTEIIPGRYAKLSISDTGVGISPLLKEKIFDPFFTTKEIGKGAGLGLSRVKNIINQSGGYIFVYSKEGEGSTFVIYLPFVKKPPDIPETNGRRLPLPKGHETILVVDDCEGVRNFISRELTRLGYNIISARNAEFATVQSKYYKNKINLIITDVVMPDTDGFALVNDLSQTRPDLEVLFVSGYPDEVIAKHGISKKKVNFLEKPLNRYDLAITVRNILDKRDKTLHEQIKTSFQETNAAKKWIMVVSGNDNVRELITVELQRLNHTVLVMPNGKESFKEYESLKDIVDIVFVEWKLPDMSGCDCVKKILQINSSVFIVYICDYIPVNEEKIPHTASILLNPVISSDLKKIISEHKKKVSY